MNKRMLAAILALAMALALLPATALAALGVEVQIGGVNMGDGTVYFKNGDTSTTGGTGTAADYNARFDAVANKLYLKNLDITVTTAGIVIIIPNTPVEIVLESSNNSIISSGGNGGIYGNPGAVTISGSGSLDVESSATAAINVPGLTVKGGATVTADGSGIDVLTPSAGNDITVQTGSKLKAIDAGLQTLGKLTVDGGEVEARSTIGHPSIDAAEIEVKNGGKLTGNGTCSNLSCWGVKAGSITVSGNSELSGIGTAAMGVFVTTDITISGRGKLIGTSQSGAQGVYVTRDIHISGGALTGTGTNSGVGCGRDVLLSGGALTGTGSNHGVHCQGDCIQSGGELTGTSSSGYGVYCNEDFLISGGALMSIGTTSTSKAPNLDGYTATHTVAAYWDAAGTKPASYDPSRIDYYMRLHIYPQLATAGVSFPVGASGGDRRVVVGHGTTLAANHIGDLELNGRTLIKDTDYTKANSASVDITFRESWLNSLPLGTHRLNVSIISGTYAPQMTYIDIVVTAPGGAGGDVGADIPKTGDGSTPWLWIGIMLLAGIGLAISAVRHRKKRHAN